MEAEHPNSPPLRLLSFSSVIASITDLHCKLSPLFNALPTGNRVLLRLSRDSYSRWLVAAAGEKDIPERSAMAF
jgi:hypothetical protein